MKASAMAGFPLLKAQSVGGGLSQKLTPIQWGDGGSNIREVIALNVQKAETRRDGAARAGCS
jgi:hypothetical protein